MQVERVVKIHKGHKEADAADKAYYKSLTPRQRIDVLLELIAQRHGPDQGFVRVCKVIKRKK